MSPSVRYLSVVLCCGDMLFFCVDYGSFKGSRFLILLCQNVTLVPDRLRTRDLHLLTWWLGQLSLRVRALLIEMKAVGQVE